MVGKLIHTYMLLLERFGLFDLRGSLLLSNGLVSLKGFFHSLSEELIRKNISKCWSLRGISC